MKIRGGFVSNSSSSSFIVMSHRELETLADFEDLLPESIESFRYQSGHGSDKVKEVCSREQVAFWLKRDLKKISLERLKEIHTGEEDLLNFTWKDFYSDTPFAGLDLPEEQREESSSSFYFYAVVYGDDSPWESFMENAIAPSICLKYYSNH